MKNLFFYPLIIALGLLAGGHAAASSNFCPPRLSVSPVGSDTGSIASGKFQLRYRIEGTGIPAVVIGNSPYNFRIFSSALYTQLRMVFLDHRGFVPPPAGRVDTTAFALDTLLEDIERARKFLKLGRIAVIGHSGHAYMALEYAKKYPQFVSHVILISAPPDLNEGNAAASQYWRDSASPERKAVLQENLQRFPDSLLTGLSPSEQFIRDNIRWGPMFWFNPRFDSSPLWEGSYVNTDMFNYVWGKVFPRLDITKGLEKFDLPVFVAVGRFDVAARPYAWDPVRSKFKDLTIRVFERSGHTPPFEEAALFNKELLAWLGDHRSASINFKPVTDHPVFSYGPSGSWDNGAVWNPAVIKDGDTLRMWYTGFNVRVWDSPIQKIGYAWSTDGIHWNRYTGNPVLTAELKWEGGNLFQCAVIKDVKVFKMWYGAAAKPGAPPTLIGYAISHDGKTWTKHPDPVLLPGPKSDWDDAIISPSTVIKEGNLYKMWFWAGRPGFPFADALPQIGLATSPDGIHWTKYNDPATHEAPFANSDPVLTIGPSVSWDSNRVLDPMVLATGSGYEMWYSGLKAPINPATKQEIGYATSDDGIHWEKGSGNPVIGNETAWGRGIYGGAVLKYDGNYHVWYACFHTPPTEAKPQIGYSKSEAPTDLE